MAGYLAGFGWGGIFFLLYDENAKFLGQLELSSINPLEGAPPAPLYLPPPNLRHVYSNSKYECKC